MNVEINDTDVVVLKEQKEGLMNCLEDSHAPYDVVIAIKNIYEVLEK